MKIIVADDSLVMRNIITKVVRALGHEALHATNGQHLIEVLEKEHGEVDLVLLDWNMPVLNGIEALKIIRSNGDYDDIPVLMVSTESEDAKVEQAIGAGAEGYLAKPFSTDELAGKIKTILSIT